MARPLRIDIAGAWYHVMNRGHRAGALFLNDTDRRRFLGTVADLPERFALEVHAFVLMRNHYHLLVRTTEANLSHAMRWLNVSYAVKFNWAHRYRGSVFQGRFKSVLIQEESKAVEVARYIHLNPVRIEGLGLSKAEQRKARVVGCENPGRELVRRRLEILREHRWSSWRIYQGLEPNPGWLEAGVISQSCGGNSRAERRAALKAYTEQPVRQGVLESPWAGLVGGIVLGEIAYARKLLSKRQYNEDEQTPARRMRRRAAKWEELVKSAEEIRGEKRDKWMDQYGDWGRDAVMYVAVHHGGLRLAEVVQEVKMKYQAAAQAVKRFSQALADHPERQRFVSKLRH
jgi:REP element-mobilizing transposase RayT